MDAIPVLPRGGGGGGAVVDVVVTVVCDQRSSGAVLRTSVPATIPPLLFGVVVVIAGVGEVVRHAVHEFGDGASNVLVEVRLELSLEVEALVLSRLVLLVVVHPLQLS